MRWVAIFEDDLGNFKRRTPQNHRVTQAGVGSVPCPSSRTTSGDIRLLGCGKLQACLPALAPHLQRPHAHDWLLAGTNAKQRCDPQSYRYPTCGNWPSGIANPPSRPELPICTNRTPAAARQVQRWNQCYAHRRYKLQRWQPCCHPLQTDVASKSPGQDGLKLPRLPGARPDHLRMPREPVPKTAGQHSAGREHAVSGVDFLSSSNHRTKDDTQAVKERGRRSCPSGTGSARTFGHLEVFA